MHQSLVPHRWGASGPKASAGAVMTLFNPRVCERTAESSSSVRNYHSKAPVQRLAYLCLLTHAVQRKCFHSIGEVSYAVDTASRT